MTDEIKDTDVVKLDNYLDGKKIAIIVSGGIAAYKAPSLARHLRQYGAEVTFYPTEHALEFIGKKSLGWSSKNNVITDLSGYSEHLFDYDAYIVAPATLNMINDIATGKAQDAARSTLASGFGKIQKNNNIKFIVVPTMHESLYDNPALQNNLKFLKEKGIHILDPRMQENKAKIPSTHSIVSYTIRELSSSSLKGKNILVSAGPVWSKIDNVRVITNIFKGRLGIAIAEELYLKGANVKLIYGPGGLKVPEFIDTTNIKYFDDMYLAVVNELRARKYYAGIFSAAIPDYQPKNVVDGKIKSQGGLKTLEFTETEKIIKKVKQVDPDLLMATFKLESNISEDQLLEIANQRLQDYEIIVANLLEDMSMKNHSTHKSYILTKDKQIIAETKQQTAKLLVQTLENYF